MRRQTCDQEPQILKLVGAGREQDRTVQGHVADCESCREAVDTTRWLRGLANTAGETRALPDPALLWWKAQLLRRWDAERRAAAPIERMHHMELAAGFAGVILVMSWQWADLRRLVRWFDPSNVTVWTSHVSVSPYVPALLVGTILFGLMLFAGVHRLLAEN
jgi:hypothetical protein